MPGRKNSILVKLLFFLIMVNVCFLLLAFVIKVPLPFREWRKGPPMHSYVAYSSSKAPKIFWVATAVFLDMYFFLIFLFHYIIIGKRIALRKWFYFSLILIILGVSFFTIEHTVRLFIKHSPGYTQFRPHPLLYWWNRPNLRNFIGPSDNNPKSTNSFGFRYGEDISYEKATDEYRIFVLGDSSTFGHGVSDNGTFAAQLEKMLNKKFHRKIRVINAACPGHTTYQNFITLKQMVLQFHPDMIIIANNDDHALEYIEDKERAFQNSFIRKLNVVLYRSDYYLLFQRVILDFKIFFLTKLRIMNSPSLVRRVSLKDYENNLKEFINITKQNNIQPVFIKMPINMHPLELFPDLKKMIYDERYPEVLSRLCQEENQILVDVDTSWHKKKKKGLYEAFHFNGYETEAPYHPSANGHLRIARHIFNVIGNKIQTETKIPESHSVETSLTYFIVSDRQDAFDELRGGKVRNISIEKAEIVFDVNTEEIKNLDQFKVEDLIRVFYEVEIVFDVNTEGIKYLDQFKVGDLVRVFYENGVVPLKASKIISINRYGEAETEPELFKIDHYIEGQLAGNGKRKIKVLFHVIVSFSYMPRVVSVGNMVDVVYSQGLLKPPQIRRIVKSEETGANIFGIPEGKSSPLKEPIKEYFYDSWFELGKELWERVAHCRTRYPGEYQAAKKLFEAATDKVAKDLGITKTTVLKTIDRKLYIKE